MNFYKRHIGDYIKDAAHLSLLEHGVYARLMDVYYTREAGIPDGQASRLIGARSKDEQQAVQNVLAEFFDLVDGVWLQNRCEREIGAATAKGDQNRENGKKGGRPRKNPPQSEPTKNPDGFEDENPDGFVGTTQKNLSQTPDTRHQTPDLKPSIPASASGASGASSADALSAADVSMKLIGWERERGKIARGVSASNAQVMDLAAQNPTADELRKAYDLAVADRQATGDVSPINAGFVLALLVKVRNPPRPREPKPMPLHALSDVQLNAEGRRVGAGEARMGESRPEYIARIQTAMAAAQGRATA
ncbi:YdaU family protein [Ralstonia syzygii]|uniref:YdaU family protein n=1 Tax=Ralstonia syzygii TaxID=28097 RepID=UPI003513F80D